MKDFKRNKEELNRELDQFVNTLNELLPRYATLLRKPDVSNEELSELGEIEHFLIEVNHKISDIKNQLEQDLFGHSLDTYFKLKAKAKLGDTTAQRKIDRLKASFEESLRVGNVVNWN
ncbi:MAG: hypothetical protein K9G40_05855 [Crocinitomicaceae bacterium]|jgi:hypothetical protein|nr:hypothetical protein [Crocinitomicaceae bacterium]MCF8432900.1 hypothetical protein [Crocinitomicaceae bacterium]